jgi:hypothetical protein
MGIKQSEFITPLASGPSPLIPSGKPDATKVFQVTRTDTAAGIVKAILPGQSTVTGVYIYGSVASDAATTASVTITISNNSGTISTGSYDVKASGAITAIVQMSNLPNIETSPTNGDLKVVATYAETGTASTTGGPWKVRLEYV